MDTEGDVASEKIVMPTVASFLKCGLGVPPPRPQQLIFLTEIQNSAYLNMYDYVPCRTSCGLQ